MTSYVQDLRSIVNILTVAISAGLTMRIIILAIQRANSEDIRAQDKGIKHCIIAEIVTLSICGVYNLLNSYFGFGSPI